MELKPCPFCGSVCFFCDSFVDHDGHAFVEKYYIECNGCLSRGPARATAKEAEEAWNRRTPDGN